MIVVKYLNLLIFLGLMASCQGTKEETQTVNANTGLNSSQLPMKWSGNKSGEFSTINLLVSQDFTVQERQAITNMANEWDLAVDNKVSFFQSSSLTSEKTNNVNNLDSLWDNEQGIYKSTSWHASLPTSALAVTQIFATRASSNDHIQILHADMILNYRHFTFSTNNSGGYDFQTVVLHEMGHFIGLAHQNSSGSIMYPSISSADSKRVPSSLDSEILADRYGISLNGVTPASVQLAATADLKQEIIINKQALIAEGKALKITLELHADGKCRHRVNNKIFHEHIRPIPIKENSVTAQ